MKTEITNGDYGKLLKLFIWVKVKLIFQVQKQQN